MALLIEVFKELLENTSKENRELRLILKAKDDCIAEMMREIDTLREKIAKQHAESLINQTGWDGEYTPEEKAKIDHEDWVAGIKRISIELMKSSKSYDVMLTNTVYFKNILNDAITFDSLINKL